MKWLILLCCLLLCGCHAEPPQVLSASASEDTEPSVPSVVEVPLRILTPVELEIVPPPQWNSSEPQAGDPITPQPGDTSETWDLKRAEAYPTDQAARRRSCWKSGWRWRA